MGRRGYLVAGALVASLVVFIAVMLVGQTPTQSAQKDGAGTGGAAQVASNSTPFDGRNEAVAVHGHWTIEVRAADGAIVSRREFENALQAGGRSDIVKILGRAYATGYWSIDLLGASGPCLVSAGGSPASCEITEAASGQTGYFTFKTLTISMPTSGADAGKLILTGTATAQMDDAIAAVGTRQSPCTPTTAPASPCPIGNITDTHSFTYASLASPIAVITGQQILVTVALSFN